MSASPIPINPPPFNVLTEYLQKTFRSKDPISIPPEILEPFRISSTQVDTDATCLRVFAQLLDCNNHTNRLRLGSTSFIAIVSIILQLPQSLRQEKLLHAFMSTIRYLKSSESKVSSQSTRIRQAAEEIHRYRDEISRGLVRNVLKVITEVGYGMELKRTATQLLSCAITDDEYAQVLVTAETDLCRLFCSIIYSARDHLFRVLVADVVRKLIANGADRSIFWREGTDAYTVNRFPVSKSGDLSWLAKIFDYLAKVGHDLSKAEAGPTQSFHLRWLSIEDDMFDIPHASSFAVTALDALTFITSSEATLSLELRELPLIPALSINPRTEVATTSPQSTYSEERYHEVALSYRGNSGYQIFEGNKRTVSELRFMCHNAADRSRFTTFLANALKDPALIDQPDDRVPGNSATRKSDVAFITGLAGKDYEWWPNLGKQATVDEKGSGPFLMYQNLSVDVSIVERSGRDAGTTETTSRNAALIATPSAGKITRAARDSKRLEGATNRQQSPGLGSTERQARDEEIYESSALEEGATLDRQTANHQSRTQNTHKSAIDIGHETKAESDSSLEEVSDWQSLAQRANLASSKRAARSQVNPSKRQMTSVTAPLPESSGVILSTKTKSSHPIARPSKAAGTKHSAKLQSKTQKLTALMQRPSQGGLKRKNQKNQGEDHEGGVDWDEAFRHAQEEKILKAAPKKAPKGKENSQRSTAIAAKLKKQAVSKVPATKVRECKGKSKARQRTDSLDETTIAATRSRRSRSVKPTKYVEDTDSERLDEDDESNDEPALASVISKTIIATRKGEPACSNATIEVEDSQRKDKSMIQEHEIMEDSGFQIINEKTNVQEHALQAKFDAIPQHGKIQQEPAEALFDLTIDQADSSKGKRDKIAKEGKRKKLSLATADDRETELQDEGEEDTAQDSYPRQSENGENANKSTLSFGSRLSQYIRAGLSTKDDRINTPNARFGDHNSFVDLVNNAKEISVPEWTSNSAKGKQSLSSVRQNTPRATELVGQKSQASSNHPKVAKVLESHAESKPSQVRKSTSQATTWKVLGPPPQSVEMGDQGDEELENEPSPEIDELLSGPKLVKNLGPGFDVKNLLNQKRSHKNVGPQDDSASKKRKLDPNQGTNASEGSDPFIDNHDLSSAHIETKPVTRLFEQSLKLLQRHDSEDVLSANGKLSAQSGQSSASTNASTSFSRISKAMQEISPGEEESRALSKAAGIVWTPLRSVAATTKDDSGLTDESLHRKDQLIHFDKTGPQNQGILSHGKKSRTPMAASVPLPEIQKHEQFKKQQQNKKAPLDISPVTAPSLEQSKTLENMAINDEGIMASGAGINESMIEASRHSEVGRNASLSSRVDENGSPFLEPQQVAPLPAPSSLSVDTSIHQTTEPSESSEADEEDESGETREAEDSEFQDSSAADTSTIFAAPIRQVPDVARPAAPAPRMPPTFSPQLQHPRPWSSKIRATEPTTPTSARESIGLADKLEELYPTASKYINVAPLKVQAKQNPVSNARAIMPPPSTRGKKRLAPNLVAPKLQRDPKKRDASTDSSTTQAAAYSVQMEEASSSAVSVRMKRASNLPMSEAGLSSSSPSFRTKLLTTVPAAFKDEQNGREQAQYQRSRRNNMFEDAETTLIANEDSVERTYLRRPIQAGRHMSRESSVDSASSPQILISGGGAATLTDRQTWVENLRRTQESVRDIVIEITDSVLFRLQSEEDAILSKVRTYRSGGSGLLEKLSKQFEDAATRVNQKVHSEAQSLREDVFEGAKQIQQERAVFISTFALKEIRKAAEGRRNELMAKIDKALEKQKVVARGDE